MGDRLQIGTVAGFVGIRIDGLVDEAELRVAVGVVDVHIPTTDGREIAADALHPTRTRAHAASRTPQAGTARSAARQNHRRPGRPTPPRVVLTFSERRQHFQCVDYAGVVETANFG